MIFDPRAVSGYAATPMVFYKYLIYNPDSGIVVKQHEGKIHWQELLKHRP